MKNTEYHCFVVLTDEGKWGRGETLAEAEKNAGIRKGTHCGIVRKLNIQNDKHRLTAKTLATLSEYERAFGLKIGDFRPPEVTDYGTILYYGTMYTLEY
jgi:hypothetical protein